MMKTIWRIVVRLPDTGVLVRLAHAASEAEQTSRVTRIGREPPPRASTPRTSETILNQQPSWERGTDSDRDALGVQLGTGFQAKQYVSFERSGRSSHCHLL